jgi:hypothetical protein
MRPSRDTIGERSLKHGHIVGRIRSTTYASWRNAKTRCFNKRNPKFKDYGARGIGMCAEWASDFAAFLRDMGECPTGFTLDRIDVNRDYSPGNCRWATKAEQTRNRRVTLRTAQNEAVSKLCIDSGVRYKSVWWHMQRGKSPEQAVAYLLQKRRS